MSHRRALLCSAISLISVLAMALLVGPPQLAGTSQFSGSIFASPVVYGSGGYEAFSLAVGDVNGDGKADLIVTNACISSTSCTTGTVGVLLGNGDGTFQTATTYDSGGIANSVAVGDVNGDGKLDLTVAGYYCANNNCNNSLVAVLLGDGDGTFQAPVRYGSGGSYAYSVAVGDVNGDGKPDLLAANYNSVGVLLGNGDGTFAPVVSYGSGGSPALSLAVGDVNRDGKPDVIVSNYCGSTSNCVNGTVGVLLGNGNGTFQPAVAYPSGGFAHSVAVADVNGDGKPDLLVADYCGSDSCSSGTTPGIVGVLLGNGDGTLQAASTYTSGGSYAYSAAVGDVNGDGKPDLVVANYCVTTGNCTSGTQTGAVGVLLGNGEGTFQTASTYSSGGYALYSVALSDVNGDGKHDVLAANACVDSNCANGVVGVLLNSSSGASPTPTSTTLVSLLNPSTFNQPVTLTATVTPQGTGTPTGTLTFYDGAAQLGTVNLSGASASFSAATLAAGSHSVTASYSGDNNFSGSTSPPVVQTVNPATSTTALASSTNPSYVNQSVTFTATPTSQYGGTLAGSVTFMQGTTALASVALANRVAAYTTTFTSSGTRQISAIYSGDANNLGSTSTVLNQLVNAQAATTTVVATSGSPSLIHQLVTFTAAITSSRGAIPDGETVTFFDGTAAMGTSSTFSGVATFSTSSLTAKTHTIRASYPGDAAFKASSGTVKQVVTLYPSVTTLTSSLNPSVYGQAVGLTATVTSNAPGGPTGTVTFNGGTTKLGTVALSAGSAFLSTSKLPAGALTITATYNGDGQSAKSSAITAQTVNQATTATALTSSVNPSASGQVVKFTATVTSATTIPTGSVTFAVGGNVLGTVTLSGGKANYSTSSLSTGSHSITVVYNGTSNISGSSSSPLVQTVK